jgi:hypothetical protein
MSEPVLNEWFRHTVPAGGQVILNPLESGEIRVIGLAPGEPPPVTTSATIRVEINAAGELVLYGVQLPG